MINIILSFVACLDNNISTETEVPYDPRPDWELFTPRYEGHFSIPANLSWYAEDLISDEVSSVARDWEIHLSCGVNLAKSDSAEDSDISIVCDDFPGSDSAFVKRGEDGSIILSRKACENMGPATARFALAVGMGFPQQFKWFSNAADGTGAYSEILGDETFGWSILETDGWRAWALERGAPGCGDAELEWSWVSNPDLYKTLPDDEIAQHLIGLLPPDSKN